MKAEGLFEFMLGSHKHLSQIVRYQTVPRMKDESVAEHSYFVAVYAEMLCTYAIEAGFEVDREKTVRMAIFHDMEESMSSDLPYNVKRSSKGLQIEFEKINRACMKQMLKPLPDKIGQDIYCLWMLSHSDKPDIEVRIVEMADRFSTIVYCAQEILLGNKAMIPIFDLIVDVLDEEIGKADFAFLLPFMKQIKDYRIAIVDPMWTPDPYYTQTYNGDDEDV